MNRLLAYYGDDFTGSTDVMEALSSHGVETVLFTRMPTVAEFTPYTDYPAIGLAGSSRSQSPRWMDENLPEIFSWLKILDARFCHYKVCSTFDSSPQIGSIGRALDIGAEVFRQAMVPLVVGAPQLKRFSFAGHLFAAYQGEVFRIDRHPVMSCHPVTPMQESDLRLHLAKQTKHKTVLANQEWPDSGIGLIDVHDASTQLHAGERLLDRPGFVVGSSGVEYALLAALLERGEISGRAAFATLPAVAQMIVVSGSVSATTERQIRYAKGHGFVPVPVDALGLAQKNKTHMESAIARAMAVLSRGKSPLVHTALGPATDMSSELKAKSRQNIGEGLGIILRELIAKTDLKRVVVAGGDSSSHALSKLDIYALTTRLPLPATPGSPLCTARSGSSQFDGIEIALKGGQVGGDDYFVALRDGIT